MFIVVYPILGLTLGDCALPVAALRAWNSLCVPVQTAPSMNTFQSCTDRPSTITELTLLSCIAILTLTSPTGFVTLIAAPRRLWVSHAVARPMHSSN